MQLASINFHNKNICKCWCILHKEDDDNWLRFHYKIKVMFNRWDLTIYYLFSIPKDFTINLKTGQSITKKQVLILLESAKPISSWCWINVKLYKVYSCDLEPNALSFRPRRTNRSLILCYFLLSSTSRLWCALGV